jgi:hypothetical protein
MVRAGVKKNVSLLGALFCVSSFLPAQAPPLLTDTGEIMIEGRPAPYRIRHLPITSFPDLPEAVANQLTERGCLIPQTYQAHHPENVVHASLEHPGSSDWAVLCSSGGTVSLLVFFSSAPASILVLATAPETARLQTHDGTGVLGFDWGIDPASPEQVREARSGMEHRPPTLNHDALADTIIGRRTIYHFYAKSEWALLEMPDE